MEFVPRNLVIATQDVPTSSQNRSGFMDHVAGAFGAVYRFSFTFTEPEASNLLKMREMHILSHEQIGPILRYDERN